jgi:alpha-beta hydrolase superfamily lysophospholipase
MQSNIEKEKIRWKELSKGISVAQFSSKLTHQQIYVKKISATKKSKKPITIFLFHDLASYHGRFMSFVNWFKSHNHEITFIMMDFLGHGLSTGTRGHIESFDELVQDVAKLFGMVEKKSDETWIALGHGIGALSLLDLINRCDDAVKGKIDKLILSNFVLHFSSPMLNIQNKLLQNVLSLGDVLKTMRPLEIYLPNEMLTFGREQILYSKDPLIVRKPTFQTFKSINSKAQSIYQDAYFLDKPTLLLESTSPYLTHRGMESFSKGFKKDLLVEKKYSNLKHDLYNERDNSNVFNDIAEWVQS